MTSCKDTSQSTGFQNEGNFWIGDSWLCKEMLQGCYFYGVLKTLIPFSPPALKLVCYPHENIIYGKNIFKNICYRYKYICDNT